MSLCLLALWPAPMLAAAPEPTGKKPTPAVTARVDFLTAKVAEMREKRPLSRKRRDVEWLRQALLIRFPLRKDPAQRREDLQNLLEASIRVPNLDNRDYNASRSRAGEGPEDVANSDRVYNIDLFNALLGHPRGDPAEDDDGKTALMYAAEVDQLEVLRTLLLFPPPPARARGLPGGQNEENPTFLLHPPLKRFEPLYTQVKKERGYVNWCDKDGYSALMHASAQNSPTAANYLINGGAALDIRCEVAQFNALQLAQNLGHEEVARAIELKLSEKTIWQLMWESGDFWAGLLLGTLPSFLIGGLQFWLLFRQKYKQAGSAGGARK